MIEHIHDLIVHYGRAEAKAAEAAYEPNAGSTDDARQDAHEAFVLLEQAIEELEAQQPFCFTDFVKRKMDHSRATWPGQTLFGVLAHARKEVEEIEDNISDSIEWIDLILLAIDGACRTGLTPEQLCIALEKKLAINLQRSWPKPVSPNHPGEHNRQIETDKVLILKIDDRVRDLRPGEYCFGNTGTITETHRRLANDTPEAYVVIWDDGTESWCYDGQLEKIEVDKLAGVSDQEKIAHYLKRLPELLTIKDEAGFTPDSIGFNINDIGNWSISRWSDGELFDQDELSSADTPLKALIQAFDILDNTP